MALLSPFDHLYCQEENLELEEVEEGMAPVLPLPEYCETERHVLLVAEAEAEAEEEWTEVLCSLVAKEGEALPKLVPDGGVGSYLRSARKEAVEWVARAAARHAFSALTALLAVNYLDRCFLSCGAAGGGLLRLQDDKPWMGRIVAVACLSLAAKVEETRLPLLLDLQVPVPPEAPTEEEGGYVFEPKTIRRMELLVLSVLGWRMNPVTPLSFIHHLLPQLCSKAKIADADFAAVGIAARTRALMRRCEAALLSVIADRRWVQYPSSVWAAAALLQATGSGDGGTAAVKSQEAHRLISLLNTPKEKVGECSQLLLESVGTAIVGHRRKHSSSAFYHHSLPPSPSGVIGSCFSCESSCDSWPMWSSSTSSSPETPPSKKPNRFADEGARGEGPDS
ncbi:cyclin-D3-2-like [Musa acuminata AAA Group]|uniref:cyclin-D3-2-like n=1 Tax=Musa acuminata AAA Group TaxID=214697 RepID=UPI0031E3BD87